MRPDGRVGVLVHEYGEGIGRTEIGIEPESDHQQHILLVIRRGEPVPLISPWIRRAGDPQRLWDLMDRVLIEPAQRTVLRHHLDRPLLVSLWPINVARVRSTMTRHSGEGERST